MVAPYGNFSICIANHHTIYTNFTYSIASLGLALGIGIHRPSIISSNWDAVLLFFKMLVCTYRTVRRTTESIMTKFRQKGVGLHIFSHKQFIYICSPILPSAMSIINISWKTIKPYDIVMVVRYVTTKAGDLNITSFCTGI